ncbi:hypothetical protein AB0D49_27125 [Streptomyces sp. NPDC048290]|uniref:hypothetical protein n=1 Tax=Streptomyces sp. NPDC048290 TaxID=3155811 RepID=UPI00343A4028
MDSPARTAYMWTSSTVGSLGGPLLVCDLAAFPEWGGAVHDSAYALLPGCDYARALAAVHTDDDDLEAALLGFGDGTEHVGLVWEMDGEGRAEVALSPSRGAAAGGSESDGFLLLRSWLPSGRSAAPRRRAAGASAAEESDMGEVVFPSGRAVVAWAAVGADETGSYATPQERAATLGALARLHPPVPLNVDGQVGLGTVLWVTPGTYRVTCGGHEGTRGRYMSQEEQYGAQWSSVDDDWSCRWVRFTRSSGTAEG